MYGTASPFHRITDADEIALGEGIGTIPEVRKATDAYLGVASLNAPSNYNDVDREIARYDMRDLEEAAMVIRGATLGALMSIGHESRG